MCVCVWWAVQECVHEDSTVMCSKHATISCRSHLLRSSAARCFSATCCCSCCRCAAACSSCRLAAASSRSCLSAAVSDAAVAAAAAAVLRLVAASSSRLASVSCDLSFDSAFSSACGKGSV